MQVIKLGTKILTHASHVCRRKIRIFHLFLIQINYLKIIQCDFLEFLKEFLL